MKREKDNPLYTAAELAELFRCSRDTIWRLGREGKIKRIKMGRLVRFELPKED